MVSTLGSRALRALSTAASSSLRRRHWRLRRRRTNSSSRLFSALCVSHSSPGSTCRCSARLRRPPCRSSQSTGEDLVVELLHRLGEPARDVHAVGDVADRHLLLHPPGPEVGPHAARDLAVQRADGVRPARAASGRSPSCRTSLARSAARRGPGPSAARARCPAASRSGPRCSSISGAVEAVVPGGHRRVGGEDGVLSDFPQGVVERQAVVLHHARGSPPAGRSRCGPRSGGRRPASMPSASSALTPPTPSTISWRMRVRSSPPYSRDGELAVLRVVPLDVAVQQVERDRGRRASARPWPAARRRGCRSSTVIGLPSSPTRGLHRQVLDVGCRCTPPAGSLRCRGAGGSSPGRRTGRWRPAARPVRWRS